MNDRRRLLAAALGLTFTAVACASVTPSPTPRSSPAEQSTTPSARAASPAASPALSPSPSTPLASTGSIVLLTNDGSLSLVEASGRATDLAAADEGQFFLPAWSPDGSRIAAVRFGTRDRSILVFDAIRAIEADGPDPIEIFRSPTIGPFYLSWTPDSEDVSFLAEEQTGLALRIAPADASAPLDGSGSGSRIRSGNPFYYDWIGSDRLFAHVGIGPDALLAEIGLDGEPVAPAIASPGDFRSPVLSPDRQVIGFVRAADDGSGEVVVAARDGSREHSIPVFGPAALAFNPDGSWLASIGASERDQSTLAIPVGPIRLIDTDSGRTRTLVDGSVVAFWWSPDGRTIAAVRVQPAGDAVSIASPVPTPSVSDREVRLLFVDVASGEIGPETVIRPGGLYVDQLLSYFDQYALSHRLWAPDSSSILVPVVAANGTTRVAVVFRNGDPAVMLVGRIGFWSP